MCKNLDWKKSRITKCNVSAKRNVLITGLLFCIVLVSAQTNTLKMKNKDINDEPYPYMKIGGAAIYPCGERFSISLEDDTRFIFSAASAFCATLLPNGDLDEPDDGVGTNGKRAMDEAMSYQKSFERIRNLKVGYHDSVIGEKWAIGEEKMQELYPNQTYDVLYDNETRTAFNYNNVFFEMLMSIQLLAKQNEEQQAIIEQQTTSIERLNERLQHIENMLNNNAEFVTFRMLGEVSINPNPIINGTLKVAYQINQDVSNVRLTVTDIQGKKVYESPLNVDQKKGNQILSIDLPTGTYMYYLENDTQQTDAKKLMIL